MEYDFVKILSFLEKYSGKVYNPNDSYLSSEMKIVSKTAELLATLVSTKIGTFESSKPSRLTKQPGRGQKRVTISDYCWIQFKRPKYAGEVYSISITALKKDNKYQFKVYTELEKNKMNTSSESREKFSKFNVAILKKGMLSDCYYEGRYLDESKHPSPSKEQIERYVHNKTAIWINSNIFIDILENDNDETIIDKMCAAFNKLIPYYDAIFDESEIDFVNAKSIEEATVLKEIDEKTIKEQKQKIENTINITITKQEPTKEEAEVFEKIEERKIELFIEQEDEESGYIYKEGLLKIRKANHDIINQVKNYYDGRCQLCGENVGEKFGKNITEAHHIEYFSKTQNNDSSNIIVLCPNCHTLIHKCNPIYDKNNYAFIFDSDNIVKIKEVGHLKK